LDELNRHLILSCSVFPISAANEIFFIKNQDGQLEDFGGLVDHEDRDSSVLYTASRTLMTKSGCLMWSKITTEPEMEDMISKFEAESDHFQFFVPNYQP
jgi:hypothetical protein